MWVSHYAPCSAAHSRTAAAQGAQTAGNAGSEPTSRVYFQQRSHLVAVVRSTVTRSAWSSPGSEAAFN